MFAWRIHHGSTVVVVGCLSSVELAASRKLLGGTFAFLGVLGSGFSRSTPGVKSVTRYKLSDPVATSETTIICIGWQLNQQCNNKGGELLVGSNKYFA